MTSRIARLFAAILFGALAALGARAADMSPDRAPPESKRLIDQADVSETIGQTYRVRVISLAEAEAQGIEPGRKCSIGVSSCTVYIFGNKCRSVGGASRCNGGSGSSSNSDYVEVDEGIGGTVVYQIPKGSLGGGIGTPGYDGNDTIIIVDTSAGGTVGDYVEVPSGDGGGKGGVSTPPVSGSPPPATVIPVNIVEVLPPVPVIYATVSATGHEELKMVLSSAHTMKFGKLGYGNTKVAMGSKASTKQTGENEWVITAVNGKISFTWHFPAWKQYATVSDCRKQSWDGMMQALRQHEQRHVDKALKYRGLIEAGVRNLPPTFESNSAALNAFRGVQDEVEREIDSEQTSYDQQTQHGLTEGVKFAICYDESLFPEVSQ